MEACLGIFPSIAGMQCPCGSNFGLTGTSFRVLVRVATLERPFLAGDDSEVRGLRVRAMGLWLAADALGC
jgi:hypothetical protein